MTTVQQIAGELVALKAHRRPGAALFLGAGASRASGIPGWLELTTMMGQQIGLSGDTDPTSAFEEYLRDSEPSHQRRGLLLRERLTGAVPSKGYGHICQLVSDGYVKYILTTNWDALMETALYRRIPADRIKLLVRGEMTDDQIADVLDRDLADVYVIKLHGDAASGVYLIRPEETARFSPRLRETLGRIVHHHCTVIGQSSRDVDVLTLLLNGAPQGMVTLVQHEDRKDDQIQQLVVRAGGRILAGEHPSVQIPDRTVLVGDFDVFVTQLDLAVRQRILGTPPVQQRLAKVEKSILTKERRGVSYINYSRSSDMLGRFWTLVKSEEPDVILFVHDPEAPGGVELQRRLKPEEIPCPSYVVDVKGRAGPRLISGDAPPHPDPTRVRKVVVIDSVSFSGRTLELVGDAAQTWFPNASIVPGAMIISQALLRQSEEGNYPSALLHQEVTDRFEIFFPWGVTQLTSRLERVFPVLDETAEKTVLIERRPWGAIEVLAEEDIVSVRLLTIEARERLSFQRHLCRDELFVALDDNIGLDVCGHPLDDELQEFDERVKSIVLEKGDYVLVPRGVWHRTKAPMDRVRLLEVAFGLYDQQDDIQRVEDDYLRLSLDGSH